MMRSFVFLLIVVTGIAPSAARAASPEHGVSGTPPSPATGFPFAFPFYTAAPRPEMPSAGPHPGPAAQEGDDAHPDRIFGRDKAKHLVVSALLVAALYRVYQGELRNDPNDACLFAAGVTGTLGIAKEIHDERFSPLDLAADAAGIAVGLVLLTP